MMTTISDEWKEIEDAASVIRAPRLVVGERKYRVFYRDIIPMPKLELYDSVGICRESPSIAYHYAMVTGVGQVSYEIRTHFYTAALGLEGQMLNHPRADYMSWKASHVIRDGEKIWELNSEDK